MAESARINAPVPDIPFFTPLHSPSPGTAKESTDATPTLFKPLRIRGKTLRNRICVSPMCQYSCAPSGPNTGSLTPYHIATLGHFAHKGAALAMVEATGVQSNGRISINCPGLWNDTQTESFGMLADFVHSQGGLIGVQLNHAGRKGSTLAPFVAARLGQYSARAHLEEGGWPGDVVGPTGGDSFDGKKLEDPAGGFYEPRQMTKDEIGNLIRDFAAAANRAVQAGFDVIEIHAAHGYLLHQFISPITNRRTDQYGGSFDNRVQIVIEVIKSVRAAVPTSTPVFLRVSCSDWMEDTDLAKQDGSWDLESTIRLAKMLPDLGVDLLDVSSGGNHPNAAYTVFNAGDKQVQAAAKIRKEVESSGKKLLIGALGMVTGAKQARDIVQDDGLGSACADIVFAGRQFLREPGWVLIVAEELGVDVAWPTQIARTEISRKSN